MKLVFKKDKTTDEQIEKLEREIDELRINLAKSVGWMINLNRNIEWLKEALTFIYNIEDKSIAEETQVKREYFKEIPDPPITVIKKGFVS